MKKFLAGLLCGIVLSFSTAAAASNTIQAYLFPSKVTFYNSSGIKTIDGTGSNAVLNYNNKAYIPLRAFTDAMGTMLDYQPPSATNGNKHQMKIFYPTFQQAPKWKDKNGYVSLGQFVWDESRYLTGGTVQLNKDMKGMQIELVVKDAKGEIIRKSDWVYIDGDNRTLKAGEIRTFRTYGNIKETNASSIEVVVHDLLESVTLDRTSTYFEHPPFVLVSAPNAMKIPYPLGDIVSGYFFWVNTSPDELILDPTPLELIVTTGGAGERQEILKEKLLIIQGKVASGSGYRVNVMWDQKDSNGKQVPPGEYIVRMKLPERITFVNARTKQKGQWVTEYLHLDRIELTIIR